MFAATIALVQNDIKKVLAYSTVSQIGFMVLAVGVVARGFAAQRVPWGTMYEFGCAATLAALLAYRAIYYLAPLLLAIAGYFGLEARLRKARAD